MPDISLLRSAKVFEFLDDAELAKIAQLAQEHRFNPETQIYEMGQDAHSLFVVKEGLVSLVDKADSGDDLLCMEVLPGECFGEVSFIDHLPRDCSAQVIRPSEVLEVRYGLLEDLIRRDPQIGFKLQRSISYNLCERIRNYKYPVGLLSQAVGVPQLSTQRRSA